MKIEKMFLKSISCSILIHGDNSVSYTPIQNLYGKHIKPNKNKFFKNENQISKNKKSLFKKKLVFLGLTACNHGTQMVL